MAPLSPCFRLSSPARLALVAATAWATTGTSVAAQASNQVEAATDSVWYVTNRAPDGAGWRDEHGAVAYGVRAFHVGRGASRDLLWQSRVPKRLLGDSLLSRESWLAALAAAASPGTDRPVLVYVHGYGTSFDEGTELAAELRRRGNFDGPIVVFSWPSRGSGFTWPTLSRPLTNGYWRDSRRATASIPDLVHLLEDLTLTLGASRLVVSAHSMGNQVLDGALRDSALSSRLQLTPLRTLAFLSPDVDATWFADSLLPLAQRSSLRQVVYGSRNDRVLKLSSVIHGAPRAGQLAGTGQWPAGAEVLDMTEGWVSGSWFTRHFGTNHALRRRPGAVFDLFGIVLRGTPGACRDALGLMAREGEGRWKLTRKSGGLPPDSAAQSAVACTLPGGG